MRGNDWHFIHFLNPREMDAKSNMPAYPWLFTEKTDFKSIPGKIKAQRMLGVPYPAMDKHEIEQSSLDQATEIAKTLVDAQVSLEGTETMTPAELTTHLSELKVIALIAYIQKLGAHDKVEQDPRVRPIPLDPDRRRDHLINPPKLEE